MGDSPRSNKEPVPNMGKRSPNRERSKQREKFPAAIEIKDKNKAKSKISQASVGEGLGP